MTLKDKKISFIGGGNMAGALISGLLAKSINPAHITVADPSKDIRASLSAKKVNCVDPTQDPHVAIKGAEVIVLAVKPQVMAKVVADFADVLTDEQVVISVAAGLTCDSLSNMLNGHKTIVRAMPNTPAMIQMGATGLYATDAVSDSQKQTCEALMRAVGLTIWVEDEDQLHAVTAVSGSAPAYFFYVMEAMIDTGEKLGLTRKDASALALQTALGSAQLAITSDDTPSELRNKVTSPNGTTQAAIESLQSDDLASMFERAMQACVSRSEAISQELAQ